jgi:hypothetical protein
VVGTYQTVVLQMPRRIHLTPPNANGPPTSLRNATRQQTSIVVHGRVREPATRQREKRLPPPPPSPGYVTSSDLAGLVEDAAALERRLLAGELPGEVLRLGAAADVRGAAVHPAAVASFLSANPELAKGKSRHLFRNPLAHGSSRKEKQQPKSAVVHVVPSMRSSSLPEPPPPQLSGWRKLTSTTRLAASKHHNGAGFMPALTRSVHA